MITLNNILTIIEMALLLTALQITTTSAVKRVIRFYRLQSFLLAIIPILTVFSKVEFPGGPGIPVLLISLVLIVLLPAGLGLFIENLLARATIPLEPGKFRLKLKPREKERAERIWQEHQRIVKPVRGIFVLGGLVALAAWIAFQVIEPARNFQAPEQTGLMISISLHLIGLYNTFNKGDIVSQAIGLLTMDHGLYLAVVTIVSIPVPAMFFIFGLYLYTLITLAILLVMLPQIRHFTRSIELDEISKDSTLEG